MRIRRQQPLEMLTISALDIFASALGVFMLVSILIFPNYLKQPSIEAAQAGARAELAAAADDLTHARQAVANALQERTAAETRSPRPGAAGRGRGSRRARRRSRSRRRSERRPSRRPGRAEGPHRDRRSRSGVRGGHHRQHAPRARRSAGQPGRDHPGALAPGQLAADRLRRLTRTAASLSDQGLSGWSA